MTQLNMVTDRHHGLAQYAGFDPACTSKPMGKGVPDTLY